MQLVDNLIIILLVVGSFMAGMTIANRYNRAATRDTKDALERQFVRLKAGADADDPVKPYAAAGYEFTPLQPVPTGDYDGDPPHEPHGAICSATAIAALLTVELRIKRYKEEMK